MKLPDLFVNAVSTWDGKALAKGQKQIGGFAKNVTRSLGLAFGTAGVIAFGKASVKAFAEDEKAAVKLTRTVNNLGLGFENTRITKFISDLEKSANVADDVLRPAFTSLLTTSGSVEKSQKLLALALDVSAGSGEDVATVANDLSAAYVGNTKGLTKYRLGLTKAELAGKSFNEIQDLLNKQFAGQNAARLDTYEGKVAALGVAFGNLQESVGQGLVEAFTILGGDNGIQGATDKMATFGETARDVLAGTASYVDKLVEKLNKLNGKGGGFDWVSLIPILGGYLGKGGVVDVLAAEGRAATGRDKQYGGVYADKYNAQKQAAIDKARAKAEADAARRAKELAALQKKAALAEKNKISLSKAAAEFDTNRISIAAALRATYDKETRLRLEALMAIEDEDGDKALDRIEQLGILTKAKQAEKLNGLKGITETELLGLNSTLLAELAKIEATKDAQIKAINASGADQAAKDAAKLEAINAADAAEAKAFAKYNDALTKQGGLNDLSFYSKKTQISTLEILELASIETTTAAQLVADEIALAAGLKTVEEIAAARKAAQIADDEAMATAAAARKAAEDQATSEYFAGLRDKTTAALTANTDLTTAKLNSIATVAAAEAEANASAIAGVAALATAIRSIPPYPTWTPPSAGSMPSLPSITDTPGLDVFDGLYIDPTLVNPGGGAGSGGNYTITINAGAIASQDEFSALLQETIQGLNRKGDPLFTAGTS